MNPFQAQYPLSPKKFWKKFVPDLIAWFFLLIVGGIVIVAARTGGMPDDLTGLAILGALALAVVVLIAKAWYYRVYIRTYFYEGGDNFITIRKNVFTPREIHVQYQKIQDVYVDQDLLDRIMGLYDVHIASATVSSGMEAHIDGVDAAIADTLKNFFLQKIQNATTMPSVAPAAASVSVAAPGVLAAQFSGNVSNTTYPIQGAWMVRSVIGAVVSSGIFGALISWYIQIKLSTDNGPHIPFLLVFLVITVLWFVLHLVGLLLWKSNYRFQFLPEYIQFNTGVISRSERHLPYKSIQDVSISQTILDRVFGLANVTIENAAQQAVIGRGRRLANGSVKLVGLKPADANTIVEALKKVILTKNSSQMGL